MSISVPPSHAAAVIAVARHELRMQLFAPLAYLFLIGFLVALAAGVFLIGGFYASDEASIDLLLVFLPWVSMVLVPALAMGAWTATPGDRGVELAMTLPISVGALVLGKFLAGLALLFLALAFTLPLPVTVLFLGDPDWGAVLGGYLGALLLLALFHAVSLFCAAVARDAVSAFVLGLGGLFAIQILGWDEIARFAAGWAPETVVQTLALLSATTWLREMGHGWIAPAGLLYFLGGSAIALWLTSRRIDALRMGRMRSPLRAATALLAIGGVSLLVVVTSGHPSGIDLTEEREFSVHDRTLQVLHRLPEGTVATVYWSASETSVPSSIRSHARRVHQILAALESRAEGRLAVRRVDPPRDSDEELAAQRAGIRQIPMSSGDHFYLGLTIDDGQRRSAIAYLDPRRAGHLEYDIALELNNLTRERPPRVGLLSPLLPSSVAEGRREGLSFVEELKRSYDIAAIPHFKEALPEGLDALVLIDATILREEMLRAIDRFVMRGGGLIVLIDPFVRFNPASNVAMPAPSEEINDISDLLDRYGVTFAQKVVGDAAFASPVAAGDGTQMSFPFWMRIGSTGLSKDHPATADLNEVFLVDPGSLDLSAQKRVHPLVRTTRESAGAQREGYGDRSPRELAVDFEPDGQVRTLAALIRGPIPSAFEDHSPGLSEDTARVFVVADVDWIFDPFSLQQAEVGGRVITRPLNDNLAFLLNMVEVASGDPALIAIRSRGRVQRPFTRVAALYKAVEGELKAQESQLARESAEIEARITQAVQQSGASEIDQLSPALRAEIERAYDRLRQVQRDLRQVRYSIRRDIDGLGQAITAINLLAGPLLVLLLWGLVRWRRRAASV